MDIMVKICPNCSHVNQVVEIFCTECDYDLSCVPATRQAAPQPAPSPAMQPPAACPQPPASRKPDPVLQTGRRCSQCGQVAPLTVMTCAACGSSLATASIVRVPDVQTAPAASPCSWRLVSLDRRAELAVSEGQHLTIGWEGELGSYLMEARKDFVSNRHGILSVIRGELFFEDQSSNGTLINNRPIPRGQARKLSDGDVLCLGGRPGVQMAQAAYFSAERR